MKKNELPEQPRYKKELAHKLGYSLSTFQRRLKALNIAIPRGLITPEEQEIIIKSLSCKR